MLTSRGDTHHDTIVVGAGAAGCVLAARLAAEAGRTVLLIEAGLDDEALSRRLARPGRVPPSANWGYHARIPDWGTSFPLPRIKAVGSTSLVQGGVALRGLPADFDRWSAVGAQWSHERLQQAFARVEADAGTGGAGRLSIRRGEPAERQPLHEAFAEGCVELGADFCADLNVGSGVGVGWVPQARRGVHKETARSAYLDPVRAAPGLTVLSGTTVTRLLLVGERVVGVETRSPHNGPRRHQAAEVVIAAGAVGSPLLLLRSGIGDARLLRAAGITVRVPLPGVGTRLRDHPAVWTTFALGAGRGHPDPLWFQVMMRHAAEQADGLPDFALEAFHDFRLLPSEEAYRRGVLVASLLSPEGTGRVGLDPSGPEGGADVELAYTQRDLVSLTTAVEYGGRVLRTQAMTRLEVGTPRLVTVVGHGGRAERPRPRLMAVHTGSDDLSRCVVTAHHLHGGCPMGADPDAGDVVDARCRVHGLEGLYIGDVSVIPTPLRANTHLLALCVGEVLSHMLMDTVEGS